MRLRKWEDLPAFMQCEEVRGYYDILAKKKGALGLKRAFDVVVAVIMLIILAIPMLIIAVMIKVDSPGPVFYRQERVTTYGKRFRIHKFRTMVDGADRKGSTVTVDHDSRITKVGAKLRDKRLDELPQLFDVLDGNMSFVGTRPEAVKYVKQYEKYNKAYYATLLLPAGITSEASIKYKDESKLLDGLAPEEVDKVYMANVLTAKMQWNLESINKFSFWGEVGTMFKTVFAVNKE